MSWPAGSSLDRALQTASIQIPFHDKPGVLGACLPGASFDRVTAISTIRTVGAGDFAGLRLLSDATRDRFHRGVLLYAGADVIAFGERMHAVPISTLWEW